MPRKKKAVVEAQAVEVEPVAETVEVNELGLTPDEQARMDKAISIALLQVFGHPPIPMLARGAGTPT